MKKLILSKEFGEILKLDIEFGFPHLSEDNIRYRKDLGGGALFDAGAYTLSAARNLLGEDIKLVWANVICEKGFEVDVGGNAILVSNNTVANCSWAFGATYRNQIRLWTSDYDILCMRAFSKPNDYSTKIILRQNGIVVEEIEIGCDDHFVNMLTYFTNVERSSNVAIEHNQILRQAELLRSIVSFK